VPFNASTEKGDVVTKAVVGERNVDRRAGPTRLQQLDQRHLASSTNSRSVLEF
jgi:hypothetical protein